MADVWPIANKQVLYTTMVALLKKYIAVGFADGSIAIVPQTTILMEDQNYWMKTAVRILIGHNCSISCLFVPDFAQLSAKNILLSGDSSGKVIMWNSLTGQTLGCFYNHSQSVTGFVQVPQEVGGKYKTSVLSIAQDNSVGLIQLEENVAFVGHKNRICAVYWRTVDHYLMMIHCIDGSLHIWHMKSGNLDRIVRDWSVDEIIATNIAKVNVLAQDTILHSRNTISVACFPQNSKKASTPIVAVALINVKKLIDEMYNGEQISNTQDTSPTGSISGSPAFERAKLTPASTEKHHNPIHYLQKKLTLKQEPKVEMPSGAIEASRGSRPDHVLASNLFSCIMSWGIDEELDNICSTELKMSKPNQLSIGIRGAGGYLSFPIPQASINPQTDWTYSPNLSAQRLLTIIAILRSLIANYNLSLEVPKLLRQFGAIVDYSTTLVPSFSFLIKFWQDAIVPLKAPIQSKTGCRATIILALIGSILPPALPLRMTKDVATSLELIIRDPGKNPYRLLAIEIIGTGFKSWEPHLNGSSLTGLTGQQNVQGAPLITPPSMIMARQALLSIANYNTGLFISTLTFDLLHAKDIWERVGGLKLLGLFIAKKPILLFNHLQPMVEAMVKMLDPNHPTVRESLQDIVTVNFADLVKIFPSIAFHPGTQRLAVGTVDGSSIIFDLRTATKLNLLEGIKSQAHGVSFSPNGKLIATLHLYSNQISFWQPSSGFLESLAGVFSGAQHPKQMGMQLPLGVSRVSAFRTFPLGAPNPEIDTRHVLESVRFEWTGERSIVMHPNQEKDHEEHHEEAQKPNRACVTERSHIVRIVGPKKGYKDTLLQRLESLESILHPLKKMDKTEATYQWASKQPMEQRVDALIHSFETTRNAVNDWQEDSNESSGNGLAKEEMNHMGDLENIIRDGGSSKWNMPNLNFGQSNALPYSVLQSAHIPSSPHVPTSTYNPSFQQEANLHPIGPNEEEFEIHLIRLGLLYCGLTTNYRLSLLLGENYSPHQKNVHQSLRMALCSHGVFYSNHPYLLSIIQNHENAISLSDSKGDPEDGRRIVVGLYLKQTEKMIPATPSSELELIDCIRALLIAVEGYMAIGKGSEAIRISGLVKDSIEKYQLFDISIFNPPLPPLGPSIDVSLTLEDYGGPSTKPMIPKLSDVEIKERFTLWEECLAVDTFTSMASGNSFIMDETKFPDSFRSPALDFTQVSYRFDHPLKFPRLCKPLAARNSIWCGGPMATAFDDIREMAAISALHYSAGIIKFRLPMIRLIRRTLRYSREIASGATHRYPTDNYQTLHVSLLQIFDELPPIFKPFNSLDLFVSNNNNVLINNVWRSFISFNHDFLVYLCSFCYLHLPIVQANYKFPLNTMKMDLYSSTEILAIILRILVFIIKSMYTPVPVNQSLFQSAPNTPTNQTQQQSPHSSVLSPGLATVQSAVTIFIISSSALLGARATNNAQLVLETEKLIDTWVYPALLRIGQVKPLGEKYLVKLKTLVNSDKNTMNNTPNMGHMQKAFMN
ncbi:hypothetical protein HK103_004064 [Boothiomyces macroporosus]|uniref:Uncharacterized protein n=1 Tax=Boothiomyces macroporosus TaxID=261099 RepID=A0AAD5UH82_9FUNG|nr:hypothetical protein HK103_004064 [Boothiomyces macroporosus]